MLEYSWFSMTISTTGGLEVSPPATRREEDGGVGLPTATDVGVERVTEAPLVGEREVLVHADAIRSATAGTATERVNRPRDRRNASREIRKIIDSGIVVL